MVVHELLSRQVRSVTEGSPGKSLVDSSGLSGSRFRVKFAGKGTRSSMLVDWGGGTAAVVKIRIKYYKTSLR